MEAQFCEIYVAVNTALHLMGVVFGILISAMIVLYLRDEMGTMGKKKVTIWSILIPVPVTLVCLFLIPLPATLVVYLQGC